MKNILGVGANFQGKLDKVKQKNILILVLFATVLSGTLKLNVQVHVCRQSRIQSLSPDLKLKRKKLPYISNIFHPNTVPLKILNFVHITTR